MFKGTIDMIDYFDKKYNDQYKKNRKRKIHINQHDIDSFEHRYGVKISDETRDKYPRG